MGSRRARPRYEWKRACAISWPLHAIFVTESAWSDNLKCFSGGFFGKLAGETFGDASGQPRARGFLFGLHGLWRNSSGKDTRPPEV